MPFSLKNVEETCQRLVNMMFKYLIGKTMEVYVDDMFQIEEGKGSYEILEERCLLFLGNTT